MSVALNRIQLLGYAGQEPKITQTKEGQPVAYVSMATNSSFLKNDEWHTETEWHHLVLFGKMAKLSSRLKKGSLIFVEGRLRSSFWIDDEDAKQRTISVVVQSIQLIDGVKPKEVLSNENQPSSKEYLEQMRDFLTENE